ncbi:hypothetical protein JCM21738_487 [Mesobacillus boroniphilus JCM 21738]|uniref:Uncharacterized protein n=1 Tax=Mesobacillus boroniphilus JCM 21738 TaxID=1294265 RepID=W4RJR4_9BACI|nr:hypothetical protein JCM21738_487 [Mesobacillus boroniphilus JCM 21738]
MKKEQQPQKNQQVKKGHQVSKGQYKKKGQHSQKGQQTNKDQQGTKVELKQTFPLTIKRLGINGEASAISSARSCSCRARCLVRK